MEEVEFEGTPVTVGRKIFIIPAMTVRQFKKYRPVLIGFRHFVQRDPTDEEIEQVMEMIVTVVKRNYPTLNTEEFLELIDMSNMTDLVKALASQSGLEKVRSVKQSGEESPSTGTT